MINARNSRSGLIDAARALAAPVALLVLAGCQPSVTATAAEQKAQLSDLAVPAGALPEVTVTLKPTTQGNAEMTGFAWYLTSVRDPARGSYTAALERRSLTRLWFDVVDEGEQRATIVLPLHDGRPTDLILSIEHGRFVCTGAGRENVCTLRVSVDGAAAHPVQFVAPRHKPATSLHLVGGEDARRLLASIAKGKRLRIQPVLSEEGSPEIEFGLNGLNPAIARLNKRAVAGMAKFAAAAAAPGA